MKALIAALVVGNLLAHTALAQHPDACDVPGYLLFGEGELRRVADVVKQQRRLNITIIGTGSSTLTGPDGALHAYPARLEAALAKRLPDVAVQVKAYTTGRQTVEKMSEQLEKILATEKPILVVWQTGTVDAMRGIEPEAFGEALNHAVERVQSKGADVILMNMQYSPRTETLIAVGPYAENMRWVAQQRGVPLFDRLGIMRHWNDTGAFDFYATTKAYAVAQQVHECIGRALAAQIMDAAQLGPMNPKVVQ
jgi:hypothetical protein